MNNPVVDTIKSRRSIRKWKSIPVPDELITEIVSCGQSAPSSCDSQPWKMIVLKNQSQIASLLADRVQHKEPPYEINSKKYAAPAGLENYEAVNTPPAMIVVCGDVQLCPYPGSMLPSLAACAENLLLAAHALGLGACWLYVYDPDMPETEKIIKDTLGLPENYVVLCLIPFGYSNDTPGSKDLRNDCIKYIN